MCRFEKIADPQYVSLIGWRDSLVTFVKRHSKSSISMLSCIVWVQAVICAISGSQDISKTKGGIRFQEYEKKGPAWKGYFWSQKKCFLRNFLFKLFENDILWADALGLSGFAWVGLAQEFFLVRQGQYILGNILAVLFSISGGSETNSNKAISFVN